MAQLYPQALGSLFIASYDSQRYGGGILSRLHTALTDYSTVTLKYFGTDSPGNSSLAGVLCIALHYLPPDSFATGDYGLGAFPSPHT
jgi:hypothetical protein